MTVRQPLEASFEIVMDMGSRVHVSETYEESGETDGAQACPRRPGRRDALALAALGTGPATAADGPTGIIQGAGAHGAIVGSYLVVLDKDAALSASAQGRAVAEEYGARIERTYTAALNGYAVGLSEAQATRLAADPDVEAVVQNRTFTIATTQPNPPSWGLDRIDQAAVPLDRATPTTTPRARASPRTSSTPASASATPTSAGAPSDGYDAIDNDNIAQDGHGHGTHVAGTLAGTTYGVAKKAKVVAVRVLDNAGLGHDRADRRRHRLGDAPTPSSRPSPT